MGPPPPTVTAPLAYEANGLRKEYDGGRVQALRGVDFQIGAGEFVSVIGASGSGKSTLLNLLGALDQPTAGSLLYHGKPLAEIGDPAAYRAREIGFIFQSFQLLPAFTAVENVQMPMLETSLKPRARRERALELLASVGLPDRCDHRPEELSGGERQRVAIARSLANSPSVLLADEPTGNLDSKTAAAILELICGIQAQHQMTLVVVTHDMGVAGHASRTLEMKDGVVVSGGRAPDSPAADPT
jgi:putative ABC transport system ATP-binding protein